MVDKESEKQLQRLGERIMTSKHAIGGPVLAFSLGFLLHPAWAGDAGAGKLVFQSQCSICHSAQSGRNMTGPSLFDVVGRPAGRVSGFHYSPANKSSELTWDAATLDRYLTNPKEVVPHTIMTYPGLKDAQKRADLIAYLATLH